MHEGRNIKRLREMLGIKQEALASSLGEEWNQKKISLLEQKEKIEPELLALVARFFQLSEKAVRNFDERTVLQAIDNRYKEEHSVSLDANELRAYYQNHKHKLAIQELLNLDFMRFDDSPELCFYKHLPNRICIEVYIYRIGGVSIKVRVINEFSGPYCKNEDVCISLNPTNIHAALHFASMINIVTIDNQIL